jgi:acetyl esterase/lipase
MLRLTIWFIALLGTVSVLPAQVPTAQTVLLWPKGAPGAQGTADEDKPSLTIYPVATNRVETGVIVFPGGGYAHLAAHEGAPIAEWLNHLGIPAFVLKYRLGPKYRHPIELEDAQRAIRYVRAHAAEYGINPKRIGVWGFSAGGHLAATTETHFDSGQSANPDPVEQQSSRPDFAILAYPVITMRDPFVHQGSRQNLLGPNPSVHLMDLLSNELQVTSDTPPTFLFHTSDDQVVPVQNSIEFYRALRKANVPAEMHIYEHGKHGVGLAADDPALSSWPTLVSNWMKARGLR